MDDPNANDNSIRQFFYGTINSMAAGEAKIPGTSSYPNADAALDAHKPPTILGCRSSAVFAASTVLEATAFAAAQFRTHPHSAIRVYEVAMNPFHSAPMAVIDELERRILAKLGPGALVSEYWSPTGTWHFIEVLGPAFTVIQEVTPASEEEIYTLRYIRYPLQDRERAQSL